MTSTETYKALSAGATAVGAAASGDYATARAAGQAALRHGAAATGGERGSTLVGAAQHVSGSVEALQAGNVPLAAAHAVVANQQVQGAIADAKYDLSVLGQGTEAAAGVVGTLKFVNYDAPIQTGNNIANFAMGDDAQARAAGASQVGVNANLAPVGGSIALALVGAGRAPVAAPATEALAPGIAMEAFVPRIVLPELLQVSPWKLLRTESLSGNVSSRTVKKYVGAMREEGGWIGPIATAIRDGEHLYLTDAHHRVAAAKQAPLQTVPVVEVGLGATDFKSIDAVRASWAESRPDKLR